MRRYFTEKENLEAIIKKNAKDVTNIKFLPTGWTNLVFDVETKSGSFMFRFPRNDFFSRMILKDAVFCRFIKGKTSFKTPDLEILYDGERPFSRHPKIPGRPAIDRYKHMDVDKKRKMAKQLSVFIQELNAVPVASLPKECLMTGAEFLDELSYVDDNFYDLSKHAPLHVLEKEKSVTTHGDLNQGNVLLDENDEVTAVLDFAFAGPSHSYIDHSKMIVRSPDEFLPILVEEYERHADHKVDMKKMNHLIEIWKYVDQEYAVYFDNRVID